MGCGASQPKTEFILVPANPKPVFEAAEAAAEPTTDDDAPPATILPPPAAAAAVSSDDGGKTSSSSSFKVAMFSTREYDKCVPSLQPPHTYPTPSRV